ncbi:hypothetical protein SAY86_000333 [Trapa natans]|uniref:Uncharacterized protein n=1 Tax=Trapa natans TaxID=22666 RepID=A0AAN7RGJ2_TRANT|nr:hypothetical protein SAY86_000333 [Trapa natans]
MESGEKSGEEAEKLENLRGKLRRRGVLLVSSRKRGPSTSTPVRLFGFTRELIISPDAAANPPLPPPSSSSSSRYISARKLAAALWEFHHYFPFSRMHRGAAVSNGGPPRLRRLKDKDDGRDFEAAHFMADPSPSSPDQPGSASSFRRLMATSFLHHHPLGERSRGAIQPMSPVSYGSWMEVTTPYNLAVTPSSSLDLRGRPKETNYSLKTSTELLKVLNRIWSLEEQHASNMSLIKALKMKLDDSKVRIKELLRDQQSGRREIDALMKQIVEDKIVRKNKEQEKIHAAVQSTRDELEDERKLRKQSESLHRKLARELSDAKNSLSSALRELENESKSRKLLEDLCDEFAIGIRDYEHEVRALKQKDDKQRGQESNRDRVILHVSESWLDERMHMKLEEAESGVRERGSIVEKLSFELETFLKAKKKAALRPREDRKSMEAVPFNEVVSVPLVGDDYSDKSDSNCFELKRQEKKDELMEHEGKEAAAKINIEEENIQKTANVVKKKVGSSARRKARNPTSLQVKFEEQMARVLMGSRYKNSKRTEAERERNSDGVRVPPEIGAHKPDEIESKNIASSNVASDFIKNQLMITGTGENNGGEASCSNHSTWRTRTSPVQQWPDLDDLGSSAKLPPVLKGSDIMAKLTEPRSKGQKSRFKASRGIS